MMAITRRRQTISKFSLRNLHGSAAQLRRTTASKVRFWHLADIQPTDLDVCF